MRALGGHSFVRGGIPLLCASCGQENREGRRFCAQCGNSLVFGCPSCGSPAEPGERFCGDCGKPLTGESSPARTPTPTPSPALPSSFADGRYEVKGFLGEGGRKRVYLAHDTKLDRDVAVAVIKTEGLDDAGLTRVKREAQAMGRLGDHPNIVTVFDIGDDNGQPYIVSQYMAGGDLDGLLNKTPEPPPPDSRRDANRLAGRAGPRARPRPRHRPPRPQARQHLADRRRHRQDRRLRPRRRARPLAADDGRDDGRDRRLHAAGAGLGPPAGRSLRPLLARLRNLRDGHRPRAVPGRRPGGDHLAAHQHSAGRALLAQPGGAARPGGADPAAPRQGPGRAAGERGGRPAGARRRSWTAPRRRRPWRRSRT